MSGFFHWLVSPDNINSNIFTMLTVILSAIISWVISAFYFHIGNRNNVHMSVLNPIKELAEAKTFTYEKLKKMEEYSKDYSVRYLKKRELKIVNELLISYKELCRYKYESVCAESLESYFMYTLRKNKVNTKVEPVWIDDDIVDYGVPVDMFYFGEDVERVLENYPPLVDTEQCLFRVITIFESYCKKYFTDKKISFFEDCNILDVLSKAENKLEWDVKFDRYNKMKELLFKIR